MEIAIPTIVAHGVEDVVFVAINFEPVGWVATIAVAGGEAAMSLYAEYKLEGN